MPGAAFRSAARALLWANVVLFAVVATIPADLQPPSQRDVRLLSTHGHCAPQLPLYHAAAVVRFVLIVAIFGSAMLTSTIEVAVAGCSGGGLPKDGGGASSTTPAYLRALFLVTVVLSAAGAALAGVASVQALEVRLGMVLRCFPGNIRAAVYASCGLAGAAVVHALGGLAIRGVRSE